MSKKWNYEAIRTVGNNSHVEAFVVIQNGGDVTTRKPLHHIVKHSPTGFEIGYGGSGPSDLAYSILVHWMLSYGFTAKEAHEQAEIHHQTFKWDFIAKERDRVCIPDDVIELWWVEQEEARERELAAMRGGE